MCLLSQYLGKGHACNCCRRQGTSSIASFCIMVRSCVAGKKYKLSRDWKANLKKAEKPHRYNSQCGMLCPTPDTVPCLPSHLPTIPVNRCETQRSSERSDLARIGNMRCSPSFVPESVVINRLLNPMFYFQHPRLLK